MAGEGVAIRQHLNRLVQPEVALAQRQHELFILPPTATVNLDSLPGDTRLLLAKPAQDFVDTYANPLRETRTTLYHRQLRPANGVIFTSTPLKLADNQWSTLALSLPNKQGSMYPGINFEQADSGFKAAMHKDEFSEEVMGEIFKTVASNGDDSDAELDEEYKNHVLKREYGSHVALLQLVEFPDSITSILPTDRMGLAPERLMTDEEYQKWTELVDSLKTNPRSGRWGSMPVEYTALPGTDIPVLHEEWTNPDGAQGSEITYTPLEVLDGDRRLGWQIAQIMNFPNQPLGVKFIHGDKEMLEFENCTSS